MAKRKHSADWMLARVREYLSGKGSYRQIARANGISERSLRDWVRKYEEQGEAFFIERAGNARRLWSIVYRMARTTRTPSRTMTFPTVRYTIG